MNENGWQVLAAGIGCATLGLVVFCGGRIAGMVTRAIYWGIRLAMLAGAVVGVILAVRPEQVGNWWTLAISQIEPVRAGFASMPPSVLWFLGMFATTLATLPLLQLLRSLASSNSATNRTSTNATIGHVVSRQRLPKGSVDRNELQAAIEAMQQISRPLPTFSLPQKKRPLSDFVDR